MHCGRRFERLLRYIARPPIATQRLSELPDRRIAYELRHPWRDGTTHVVFTGVELLEKLAVLTPSPRGNMTRYHGILAPGAKWRSIVVRDDRPTAVDRTAERARLPNEAYSHRALEATVPISVLTDNDPPGLRERRLTWAELMLRVFQQDVLKCPKCGGRAAVISAITQPTVVTAILACLGFSIRAPPIAPARQLHFDL